MPSPDAPIFRIAALPLLALLLLAGCSGDGDYPALDAGALANLPPELKKAGQRINAAYQRAELWKIRRDFLLEDEQAAPLLNVWQARWDRIEEDKPAQQMISGLLFLDASIEATTPGEYVVSALFRCDGPIAEPRPKNRYIVQVTANVDDSHRQYLPAEPAKAREEGYAHWYLATDEEKGETPLSQWQAGQEYLLERTVKTAEHIPYRLALILIEQGPPQTRYLGKVASCGWLVDIYDPPNLKTTSP